MNSGSDKMSAQKKIKERLTQLIKNIYTSGACDQLDLETIQKIVLLNIMFTIGVPMLIVFGVTAFLRNNINLGVIENISVVVIIFAFFHMRKTKNYILAGYISSIFMMMLFLTLFITGGIENSGHLWSFSLPLFLLFIFGIKKGSIFTLLFLLIVFFILLIPTSVLSHKIYHFDFLIRYIGTFILITITALFFEYIRTRTNKTIEEKNLELEKTVRELQSIGKILQESEKRFRELSDLLPQPVYEADLRGNITFLSRSGYELSGYAEDDFKDSFKSISMFVPKDHKRLIQNTKKIFKRKKIGGIEYRIKRKDGSSFPVIIHSAPIIKDGRIYGTRGTIIDITKLKQAEEEKRKLEEKLSLSEKMEAVGQLAGGVAHDLNNILNAIVGYPDLLLMNLRKNSSLRHPIETIKASGQKAAAIVQDLLTLARRGVPGKEVVNLNSIIKDYLKSPEFEKLISYHPGINIRTNLETRLFNLKGSPIHLTKTIMNLVSNAVESMLEGGTVHISTLNRFLDNPLRAYDGILAKGKYVVLKISDQGIGITGRSIKKIFEPFYTKKAMGRSGTGLGMTVVWGTVIDHHGNLIINSSRNKGTTFELYFPFTKEKRIVKKTEFKLKNLMGNGEIILVVDDENDQRKIAFSLLNKLGYTVHTLASGEEAINYIKRNSPDLVVLDMIMNPGMDGLDTFRKMKEIKPEINAIITSGYSETKRVKEALKTGASQYIKKPYTLQSIGIAVRLELEKKNSLGFYTRQQKK